MLLLVLCFHSKIKIKKEKNNTMSIACYFLNMLKLFWAYIPFQTKMTTCRDKQEKIQYQVSL